MSLSILCATRDPGERVRALLEQLRPVADEIVVAVDSRVDPALIGDHAAVADRLLRFEFGPPNSSLAWLHTQCRGDWVFTIAGDEVASPGLVAALPELTARRDLQQVWAPTRWVFPDARHWLNESPWFPDFHNRLVRNDGTLRFLGRDHTGAAPAYPALYVEAPLYHLNLALLSEAERREKVRRAEERTPGLVAPGGLPLNEAYYLPELHAGREPEPVPGGDAEALRAVMDAMPSGAAPPDPPPLAARRAEIESVWSGRSLAPAARATLEPIEAPPRPAPGEALAFHVRVRNEGPDTWPWGPGGEPMVSLGYRLMRDGSLIAEGPRSPFPCDVGPGDACIVPLVIEAPEAPGEYVIEIDVVNDPVRWFGCAIRVPLVVRAAAYATSRSF